MYFKECHPIINLIFYIGAFIMGMCYTHPIFLLCSFFLSMVYYIILRCATVRSLVWMIIFFLIIALGNPIFNTHGESILFYWFNERPYTLEALYYGISMALMFLSIMAWFSTYNKVMTSDKFLYCFGKMWPSVSIILCLVFRLIPNFHRKIEEIINVRRCMGKLEDNINHYKKIEDGLNIISILTSWSIDGALMMADSMQSRGFGTGKRTSFSIYERKKRSILLSVVMIVLMILTLICAACGGMDIIYFPRIIVSGIDNHWTASGIICYLLFLSIPILLHIMEEIKWYISRLKI